MSGWLYLFQVMAALLNAFSKGMETQRKVDESRAKRELIAQQARINEAKIAHENNRANVLDEIEIELRLLEIERKKLELIQKRRDLCLDAPTFEPENPDTGKSRLATTPSDYDVPS